MVLGYRVGRPSVGWLAHIVVGEWLEMDKGVELGEDAPRAADAAGDACKEGEEERMVLGDALRDYMQVVRWETEMRDCMQVGSQMGGCMRGDYARVRRGCGGEAGTFMKGRPL